MLSIQLDNKEKWHLRTAWGETDIAISSGPDSFLTRAQMSSVIGFRHKRYGIH